jgi:hypothetical protein
VLLLSVCGFLKKNLVRELVCWELLLMCVCGSVSFSSSSVVVCLFVVSAAMQCGL